MRGAGMGEEVKHLNRIFNNIQWKRHQRNVALYGTGFYISCNRKWFNPLRYLLGELKVKALNNQNVYVVKNK